MAKVYALIIAGVTLVAKYWTIYEVIVIRFLVIRFSYVNNKMLKIDQFETVKHAGMTALMVQLS